MRIFRGFHHPGIAPACALTIGNFDGVHRGHQAMLALLNNEARHRGVPSSVMTFEPHPRDYFAAVARKSELAPARIATLRDKLTELERCGVEQCVVLPFDAKLSSLSPQAFIDDVLVRGLGVKYVLVGDDFRFGARRAGDYAMLDAAGNARGFDVARMNSYEVHGLRVSSSAVREALGQGRMDDAARLLGRPYSISGHVVHGRKLGRDLGASGPGRGDGFRTLNLRFAHWKPAASGIFAVRVHGLTEPPPGRPKAACAPLGGSEPGEAGSVGALGRPLPGVANLGIRPSIDPDDVNGGRVLLETHCLEWPDSLGAEGAYGKIIRVELLHKLHDELRYDSLDALTRGIRQDCDEARAYFAATRRQTTRDRI
ncbi:bifunctional riboflavin kinase/FAD synthetase [Variovorax terrae]|uniref:Bifunctional riboflavin kinase/FMN adenylyltransferase n=1 Tax=Variovorax terrae TaxID=2923278 RepID=A0A9X1VZX1_9BURK|nr:bifunctional riboflavin kinase/FAD synthetase [Variovorax terrae]MCJ0765254.1 bifunctional riboflavin kinase/FAD synthetase [Variovorax terrae]